MLDRQRLDRTERGHSPWRMLGRARNDNPAKDHTVPMQSRKIRQGDVFTMEQARRFVDNVRDPYKPAAWLLIFAGLRPSELCGLRVGSIDFVRNSVPATRVPLEMVDAIAARSDRTGSIWIQTCRQRGALSTCCAATRGGCGAR